MRRLLIFGLLGPLLGFVTAFYGIVPLLDWIAGGEGAGEAFDPHQVVLLPAAYFLGLVPALLTGSFDGWLARRDTVWRPLWTTLFAFAAGFLPLATAIGMGFVGGPALLLVGLCGVVPGFVCSLLSQWADPAVPARRGP